jgi:ADP-ribose pyrophosphatase YjhB (NUDIX family)
MDNQHEDRLRALATINEWAGNIDGGVPHDLFIFLSRLMPITNVDLLIRDERLGTLLTWRDDEYYGPGWHVPGGVIRYKETFDERIRLTARRELDAEIEFDPEPIAVIQSINPERRARGHFISLLYRCRLLGPPAEALRHNPADPRPDQWAWHRTCPPDLIPEQEPYRGFL